MSFDIFLQRFRNGELAPFSRAIFDEIFLPYCANRKLYDADPGFASAKFPDGSQTDIYLGTEANIDSLTFNRCGGEAVFDAMYKLAAHTSSVIYWPSEGPAAVITDEATRKELPEDFPDKETAKVVSSGADIMKAIEES